MIGFLISQILRVKSEKYTQNPGPTNFKAHSRSLCDQFLVTKVVPQLIRNFPKLSMDLSKLRRRSFTMTSKRAL